MFALWMVLLFLILGAAPPTVSFKPEFMHIAVASEWYQKNIMLIFFTKNSFIKYLDRHKIKGHVQSCGVPIDSGKDSYLRFTSYLYYLKYQNGMQYSMLLFDGEAETFKYLQIPSLLDKIAATTSCQDARVLASLKERSYEFPKANWNLKKVVDFYGGVERYESLKYNAKQPETTWNIIAKAVDSPLRMVFTAHKSHFIIDIKNPGIEQWSFIFVSGPERIYGERLLQIKLHSFLFNQVAMQVMRGEYNPVRFLQIGYILPWTKDNDGTKAIGEKKNDGAPENDGAAPEETSIGSHCPRKRGPNYKTAKIYILPEAPPQPLTQSFLYIVKDNIQPGNTMCIDLKEVESQNKGSDPKCSDQVTECSNP
eukprot:GHVS01037469.1.p1 GENE.GHVS01037469.1~~GHVS01037469.1.p1  ORF type:complete len:367 (+),score=9.43 GHVS01037469.1:274-1374(+)